MLEILYSSILSNAFVNFNFMCILYIGLYVYNYYFFICHKIWETVSVIPHSEQKLAFVHNGQ